MLLPLFIISCDKKVDIDSHKKDIMPKLDLNKYKIFYTGNGIILDKFSTKYENYIVYKITTDTSFILGSVDKPYDPANLGDTFKIIVSNEKIFNNKEIRKIKKLENDLILYTDNEKNKIQVNITE